MTPILFLLFGAAFAAFALDLFDSDDDSGTSGTGTGSGDDLAMDDVVFVDDGSSLLGDDGAQTYLIDPSTSGPISTQIDAGCGNDVIDLARLFRGTGIVGSDIDGGAGDDSIEVTGEASTIDGGAGNDTILAELFTSTVNGGAGDDAITVVAGASDPVFVNGDAGDDTIDTRGSENVVATGGAGDDVILTEGGAIVGTGYAIAADGGAGDDTLTHETNVFPLPLQDPSVAPAQLSGGEGADTFDIRLTVGNGFFADAEGDPDVFLNEAAVITDFEQGVDVLTIDMPDAFFGYIAESGTLTEDTVAGETAFTLRLTSDNLPDQDVTIRVAATGLSWSDVTFTGTPPATLI